MLLHIPVASPLPYVSKAGRLEQAFGVPVQRMLAGGDVVLAPGTCFWTSGKSNAHDAQRAASILSQLQ